MYNLDVLISKYIKCMFYHNNLQQNKTKILTTRDINIGANAQNRQKTVYRKCTFWDYNHQGNKLSGQLRKTALSFTPQAI